MEVRAKLSHLRIAPRKVRLVADLVRGKKTATAQNLLNFTRNKSAAIILKLLNQAVANAKNNSKLDETNLFISKITVDAGPILKRFRPRARGSANEIQKKTSHITIILDEVRKGLKREVAAEEKPETAKAEIAPSATGAKEKERVKAPKELGKTGSGAKQKIFRRQVF